MTPDLDISRSANLLVKQRGQDAPIHAAMRAGPAFPQRKNSRLLVADKRATTRKPRVS